MKAKEKLYVIINNPNSIVGENGKNEILNLLEEDTRDWIREIGIKNVIQKLIMMG